MAQHDYDINSADSISGLQFRQDVNAVLAAILSGNSGATAPVTTVAGMLWVDTSTTPNTLKIRNKTNDGWNIIEIERRLGTPVASGATTTVGTYGSGQTLHITGSATISSFGVSTTGTVRTLIFDSTPVITHNATSLICPSGADLSMIAGTIMTVVCEDGPLGYWRVIGLQHPNLSMLELSYLDGLSSNIQTQLNGKQATLSFDATPTNGSTNPVTSDGVFDALALKADTTALANYLALAGGTMTGAITALRETKVAMGANDIDLSAGNLFTKTISGATTLTVSNVLASGSTNAFILELTNGGSAVITWWSSIKWTSKTAPTLTASGVDILGFYTHDGGTTWRGYVMSKDNG